MDFYRQPQSERGRKAHRHRKLRKVGMLCGLSGILCFLIALTLSAWSLFYRGVSQQRMLWVSVVYLTVALVCFVMRFVFLAAAARYSPVSYQPGVPRFDENRRRRGSTLVLLLFILAVCAVLVGYAQSRVYLFRRYSLQTAQKARVEMAAMDAVLDALQKLAEDDPTCDHTNEPWAIRTEWTDPAGISVRIQVRDENRAFDINNLICSVTTNSRPPAEVVMDLLTLTDDFAPAGRVAALKDWLDADEEGPYESRFYQAANYSYRCANRHLYTWGEWAAIHGFDPDYFRPRNKSSMFEPFREDPYRTFTVLPLERRHPIRVNVNTAPTAVLTGILGFEYESIAQAIVAERNRTPLRTIESISWVPPALQETVRTYLTTQSRFFSVSVYAHGFDQRAHIYALVERTEEGHIHIAHWVRS